MISTEINGLVGFLIPQNDKGEWCSDKNELSLGNCSEGASKIQCTMALYQEFHTPDASKEESFAAFKKFLNEIGTQIFTIINNTHLICVSWLQDQIEE